jgi:sulfur carrier protein
MTLLLNGTTREFAADQHTVTSLLDSLGLAGKPVVVELDREAVFRSDYDVTAVRDGATIEIVTIAAGG